APHPEREVRAVYDDRRVRVYQAFSPEIADAAVAAQTLRPPFSRSRSTWLKSSFAWMMHPSGWATKPLPERGLAIGVERRGVGWVARACVSVELRAARARNEGAVAGAPRRGRGGGAVGSGAGRAVAAEGVEGDSDWAAGAGGGEVCRRVDRGDRGRDGDRAGG